MHRLILAMILLATGPTAASAADDFPYGSSLSFAAVRNGQTIGHHRLTFQRDGTQLKVLTQIDLAVKVMGVTAYRYMHRAQEVWSGDTFQGLTAQTDDDGKKYLIQIRRDGAALAVERNARPDVVSPATLDRDFQRDGTVVRTTPAAAAPALDTLECPAGPPVGACEYPDRHGSAHTSFRSWPGDNQDGACLYRCNALPLHG